MPTVSLSRPTNGQGLDSILVTRASTVAFWQSKNVGYGRSFVNTVLTAYAAAPTDPLIDTGKLRLSKDPSFQPTPASVIGDLTPGEADFSGYTPGGYAVTVPDPVNLDTVTQGVVIDQVAISASGSPFVGNNLYGWWIDDGTNVIAYEVFGLGVTIAIGQPGDFLDLAAVLPFQLGQGV